MSVNLSTLTEEKTKNIIDEIMEYLEVDSIPKLASELGYTKVAVYKWIERRSIPVNKLTREFPEFNETYLSTGEGELIKKDQRFQKSIRALRKLQIQSEVADNDVNEVREQIELYRQQGVQLTKMQLPPDAALELLRSSVRLIQAYIDAVEEVNKRQSDDDLLP